MLQTLTVAALALILLGSSAMAGPAKHCKRDAQTWWLEYAAIRGVVDLSRSAPQFDVAYLVWPNGFEQSVRLGPVDGKGYCAFPVRDNVTPASAGR